jgi:hypothetical protein
VGFEWGFEWVLSGVLCGQPIIHSLFLRVILCCVVGAALVMVLPLTRHGWVIRSDQFHGVKFWATVLISVIILIKGRCL